MCAHTHLHTHAHAHIQTQHTKLYSATIKELVKACLYRVFYIYNLHKIDLVKPDIQFTQSDSMQHFISQTEPNII